MAGVRALLQRVQKLEAAKTSKFAWIDQFEAAARTGMAAGTYDRRDMSVVVTSVLRWRRDRLWELWR